MKLSELSGEQNSNSVYSVKSSVDNIDFYINTDTSEMS